MYQQQNIAQQPHNQSSHVPLQDGDLANVVLNELKRVAREYTTACLEASNPDIRHLFEQLLNQTLHDQAHLYSVISQLHLYGQPSSAMHNELLKEANNHHQQLGGLQSFMQQWHGIRRGGQIQQQPINRALTHQQQGQPQQQQMYQGYQNNQNQMPNNQQSHQTQQAHQLQHQSQLNPIYQQPQQSSIQHDEQQSHQLNQQFNQQHHSAAASDPSRETGSEPTNNHATGASFTQ